MALSEISPKLPSEITEQESQRHCKGDTRLYRVKWSLQNRVTIERPECNITHVQ